MTQGTTDVPFTVHPNEPTEIVIGLVGGLGSDWTRVCQIIKERLERFSYSTHTIRLSGLIEKLLKIDHSPMSPFERGLSLIDNGNNLRRTSKNHAILALAAAQQVSELRPTPDDEVKRTAYIIRSLKHPQEVAELRKIYPQGFFLFALHTPEAKRVERMSMTGAGMTPEEAATLLERDRREDLVHGQHTDDTFHLADFFLADEDNDDKLRWAIWRCIDIMFGMPLVTPTFNEFAMFMAFASSLRSGDMNRQVGAVIARSQEILSTGANDCPRPGGGLYWPKFVRGRLMDEERGRDFMRGGDSNSIEKAKLIQEVVSSVPAESVASVRDNLSKSALASITEFGRSVHAEMEALLGCARNGISCRGATLFTTTFPCHNCAKHIIAAGITQVLYVEPYLKSRALEFHDDAITTSKDEADKLRFKPFIGVGPRRFFDLFSLTLGSGRTVSRQGPEGKVPEWVEDKALPRLPMFPLSYRDFEAASGKYLNEYMNAGGATAKEE